MTEQQTALVEKLQAIEDINFEFRRQKDEIMKVSYDLSALKNTLDVKVKVLETVEKNLNEKTDERFRQLKSLESGIKTIIAEKSKSFPWLSNAISDYLNLLDNTVADYLVNKKNAAFVSAHKIREISTEKRILSQQLLLTRYRVKYYESLFPFLTEFIEDDIDDLLLEVVNRNEAKDSDEDPIKHYLSSGEFENLTTSEKNQKALDRYLSSRKSPYQIGRDYERYIGFEYEQKGYRVKYQGIEEGLEDLGRDLICTKDDVTEIVQCKCWSSNKVIHEKHINQLFGTTVKYFIDKFNQTNNFKNVAELPSQIKEGNIKPIFVTSTKLSATASDFAKVLGVTVVEGKKLKPYPIIKCHTNKQTGEKIYHLPFDQMYDKTIIENKHGEFYAMTVNEAENRGFRRAWRWHGND